MANKLGIIFLGFMVLVGINYLFTMVGGAFASGGGIAPGFAALAEQPGLVQSGRSTTGLAEVDLSSAFAKGGSGWNAVTQGYGRTQFSFWYVGQWHNGIDIAARYGAPIYSPDDGTVIAVGNQDNYCPGRGFGKFLAVKDPANDLVLWYAHLGSISVREGDIIKKGDEIAKVGASGFETGTHLHLSIFNADGFSMKEKNGCGPDADGKDLNPLSYLGSI